MLHPWDMQLWVAKELPPAAIYIPNNVLIATRLGEGATGIRNADHDGDRFLFSDDPDLVKFCKATPESVSSSLFSDGLKQVRSFLNKSPAFRGTSISDYRGHVLSVETRPVQGLACAAAEKEQQAVSHSVDPMQSGAMLWSIKLSECAHMANDAPKKFEGSQVLELIDTLLGQAGLKRASSRSSNVLRPRRRLQHLDRSLILEALKFPPSSVS